MMLPILGAVGSGGAVGAPIPVEVPLVPPVPLPAVLAVLAPDPGVLGGGGMIVMMLETSTVLVELKEGTPVDVVLNQNTFVVFFSHVFHNNTGSCGGCIV